MFMFSLEIDTLMRLNDGDVSRLRKVNGLRSFRGSKKLVKFKILL
jgi:hypothetical protein